MNKPKLSDKASTLPGRKGMSNGRENKILDAVRREQVEWLRGLLRDANLDPSDLTDATVAAASTGNPLFTTLLVPAGADLRFGQALPSRTMTKASRDGSFGLLKDLLAMGADPNARNDKSVTPLCAGSVHGHAACVDLLMKAGADPNARGHLAITPLQLAAAYGHTSVVTVLLDAGADPSLHDPMGRGLPQFLAHKHGHGDLAAKIRAHGLRARAQRAVDHLQARGWEPFDAPEGSRG